MPAAAPAATAAPPGTRRRRQVPGRAEEGGEGRREQARADQHGDAAHGRERALQRALLLGGDPLRHQRQRRPVGETGERIDGDCHHHHGAGRRHAEQHEPEHAEGEAGLQRAPLAEPAHRRPDQQRRDDHRGDAHQRQRGTDHAIVPAVAQVRVQHEHRHVHLVRDEAEEADGRQREQLAVRSQQAQRADRVGLAPVEPPAPVLRCQRLGQHQQAVQRAAEAERRGRPERQPRIARAEPAAERRPDDEADAEGRAEQAVGPRPLGRRGDVADVGRGGRHAGRGDARDDPAEEQPGDGRRQRHDDVVDAEAEIGEQDHRAAAVAVREQAEERRAAELHQRPGGAEQAEVVRGARDVAAGELRDQPRQHRDHDAEREHVQQRGDEDEAERGALRAHAGAPCRMCRD
ncbi:MAG: hypothetical protein U1F30_15410 [Steroidobacteraceae bacterium]